jgi:hypothetical protein
VALRLPAEETERLRSVAAAAKATLNDVLMSAFVRALVGWNAARSPVRPQAICRLTMPFNLRLAKDKRMPSANVMTYAFVQRRVEACGAGLLASLRDQSQRAKTSGKIIRDVSRALGFAAASPFAFRLGLRSVGTLSTAVLSNLGDPTRRFDSRVKRRDGRTVAGDLELLEMCGAPPVRPGTRASVAIFQCDRRLTLCLLTDPKLFDRTSALSLLDTFGAELRACQP